jgi:predicted nucleotidyltransferase
MSGMTDQPPQNSPILTRFREALAKVYGDRLERVVLFGSRARGDAHTESDYDIAVFCATSLIATARRK